jgi:hypothetical protein
MHPDAHRRRFLLGAGWSPFRIEVSDALEVDHPAGGRIRLEPFANRLSRLGTAPWGHTRTGTTPGALNRPRGLAVAPDGTIWVANGGNDELLAFDAEGTLVRRIGDLRVPRGLAVDAAGAVYVAERLGDRVSVFSSGGALVGRFADDVRAPVDVAVLPGGAVVVAEPEASRLSVFEAGAVRRLPLNDAPLALAALPSGALAVASAAGVVLVDPHSGRRARHAVEGRIAGLGLRAGALHVQVFA